MVATCFLALGLLAGCAAEQPAPMMAVNAYLVPSPSETAPADASPDCVMVAISIHRADGTLVTAPRIFAHVGEPASIAMQGGPDSVLIAVESRREQDQVVVTTTATLDKGVVLRDCREADTSAAPVAKPVAAPS